MRTLLISLVLLTSLSAPFFVSAQNSLGSSGNTVDTTGSSLGQSGNTNSVSSIPLSNPLKAKNLEELLNQILEFVIRIGAVVVVLMLVYVGFKFVVAQGNDSKLTEARQMLLWTIVGALILLGAQVIASGISATVNALKAG